MNEYYIHLLILIGIYLIFAQGLNLIMGLGGLLNLAHVASYAIGAYTTALLSAEHGFSFWLCFPLSMLTSALLATMVGAIALRLSEEYFMIGSLAFSSLVSALIINWKSLTRGVLGIPAIPRPEIFGIDFYQSINFLYLVIIIDVLALTTLYLVFKSKTARNLRALSENEFGAAAIGKNKKRESNIGFTLSAVYAGMAGSLFAYYLNYIDPSSFTLNEMVFVLSIAVVGRPGSFWGVVFSTVFLVLLPEPLRELKIPPSVLGPIRQMLYALILFGVLYWRRSSLFPVERRV